MMLAMVNIEKLTDMVVKKWYEIWLEIIRNEDKKAA